MADKIKRYEKIAPVDLIRNSVQIRFYKINTPQFRSFCSPLNATEELYQWREDAYDGNFLGYMAAIVPLLEMDANGWAII